MFRIAIWLCCTLLPLSSLAVERPNVLFLLSDDQRPDTIGALGNDVVRTPNLDRLVHEGMVFTRAITAIPICVASRAEILTGRDGLQNGNSDFGFSPRAGVACWAETMRAAGYQTCYVGKWHTAGRPSHRGYSSCEGLFAGGGGRLPLSYPRDWKDMPVTGYGGWVFQTDIGELFPERGVGLTPDISQAFADAAITFIQQPRTQPFFLHVNFTAPHDPLLLPSQFQDAYDASTIPLPANFASQHPFDHGNYAGRDEQLFHWPRTAHETRGALYPTACDLCDVRIPASVQRRSLKPVIEVPSTRIYPAVFGHFRDTQRMIRTDTWKYIEYPLAERRQLFQLTSDPAELQNLVDEPQFASITSDLKQRLRAAFADDRK